MTTYVIKRADGKYAEAWFFLDSGLVSAIKWGKKSDASSFDRRSDRDTQEVLAMFPDAKLEVR